jgi:cobalt-zinc-cadmium efflux system protein
MSAHAHERGDEGGASLERRQQRRLLAVLVLISTFFVVELIGAKVARSDVLEADAYHLLMDVLALAVSLTAMRLASARPSERFTFGLRRLEPLAALFNAALVLGVAFELAGDATGHLADPRTPRSGIMLAVASAALVVNGLSAWLLHGAMHHGHDHVHGHGAHHLNLRGVWLHLIGDALGSFAAFSAGLTIQLGGPPIIDPIASLVVVAILTVGALRLLRDAGLVLLDAAPTRLPVGRVKERILAHPGVASVHVVHVWSLGTGHDAITAHVRAESPEPDLAASLSEALRSDFAAEYVTVQVDVRGEG